MPVICPPIYSDRSNVSSLGVSKLLVVDMGFQLREKWWKAAFYMSSTVSQSLCFLLTERTELEEYLGATY